MPRVVCVACEGVVYDSPDSFSKLPKKCSCGGSEYRLETPEDKERKRLRRLEERGCLISSLLGE